MWRRRPLFKTAFNLAHFTLESTAAIVLFGLLSRGTSPGLVSWAALLVALFVPLVCGGIIVATAIALFEGGLATKVRGEILNAPVFYLPGALLGASVAIQTEIGVWLGLVAFSPVPVVWYVMRAHGALLHRYTDLDDAHEFGRIVGSIADPVDIARRAANLLADNFRAGSVAVRLWTDGAEPRDIVHGDPLAAGLLPGQADGGPDPHDDARGGVRGCVLCEPGSSSGAAAVETTHPATALVARLYDGEGPIGAIALADRRGAVQAFDEFDRSRLETVARQLALAVRKAQIQSEMEYHATHDRLTGLPNRSYFDVWVSDHLSTSPTATGVFAVLDLDRFKEVNDVFGHQAGDQLLIEVARRLRATCGEQALIARFGGDEFALFFPSADIDRGVHAAHQLAAKIEEAIELGPASVAVAASIGIAAAPQHGDDVATLYRRADIAMYDAKRRFDRHSVYRSELDADSSARLLLLADLRDAIARGTITPFFQPKVDVTTGKIVAAEALARWDHPARGFVPPDVFIGLAEQSGLIDQLTQQILSASLLAAADWADRGWGLKVAVNVSAQSLLDERLVTVIREELEHHCLPPELLVIEITESTVMSNPERTRSVLDTLSRIGVGLSVDDFGTGYSSLVNLRRLPVTEIKVDRSFVMTMLDDPHDDVIVRSTIDLGHNLGLTVVAEGVESDDILEVLARYGCDHGQGYGIARPMARADFDEWVATRRSRRDEHAVARHG